MKKIFTLLFLLISIAAFSQSTTVVISQVYAGGGTSTAGVLYKYDYVELHNISAVTQDISNYSLQYGSATGNIGGSATQIYGFQANTTIPAGGYLLMQLGAAGGAGADLPVTADLVSANLNLGGAGGKIVLANVLTGLGCGATASPCTLPSTNIIDLVAWGTANNAEGGATVGTLSITTGAVRKTNGCQDIDNNLTDFDIVSNPVPRNSFSSTVICGATGPVLSAGPAITNLTGNAGVASAALSYNLSGTNLTGFPGNISVTASAGLEVSLSSGAGFAGSVNVPYSAAVLAATPIYVRTSAAAPQGALAGTVINSGGGASNAVVNVTGAVYQNYYNTKANNGLTDISTWSSTVNGAGASPADFSSPYQLFNIVSQANADYIGVWNVTGAGNTSRVIVGDGVSPISFTVFSGEDSVTSATRIDVLNNATLVLQNNRRPFLNNMATGSTVEFAQTGLTTSDTIKIPSLSYYNLTLRDGIKILSSGTTTVRGEFNAINVINFNGAPSPFSTLNALGNVLFSGTTTFEPLPSGDNARLTLAMNGNVPQELSSSNPVYLFRLQRDTTTSNGIINVNVNNLYLGNAAGGGLRLNQGAATTTVMNMTTLGSILNFIGGAVITPASNGKINSSGLSINIDKSSGNSNAGTLRFTDGSSLLALTMNFDPAYSRDSVFIADSIDVEFLSLTKGKIIVSPGAILNVTDGPLLSQGQILGGSAASFVEGKLRRSAILSAPNANFPVGKGSKYAPVDLENPVITGPVTVEYYSSGQGNYVIDPATLSTYPSYEVSRNEYWVIENGSPFALDITFHYTDALSGIIDPTQVKIAHYDGTDWNDLGGTAAPTNTTTNGTVTVTGVNTFSPFTFAARLPGVIPVKLSSFNVQKLNSIVKIKWTTEQEINSREFIVERSTNGSTWTTIAIVPAAGNSSIRINYTTTDNNPVKGINFYRIRQVDLNNRFDYSATKNVLFNTSYEVLVTPNPARDIIHVYANNDNRNLNIQLTDISGKVVRMINSDQVHVQLNTAALARGIYYVKVFDGKEVFVSKILLQ